jgi:hypothetical protein
MEMSQSFNQQPESPVPAQSLGTAIYTDPDDVVGDPKMTTAEKRGVLASWISDARTVENAPSLRRLDSGAVVEVDAILQALGLLDEAPDHIDERKRLPASRRRRSVISRWLSQVGAPNGSNDNDDDPPPAPAGLGIPFRPKFLAATSPRHWVNLAEGRRFHPSAHIPGNALRRPREVALGPI